MPNSASVLKFFRLTHRYIGIFIAPALLFFAFTGAMQTAGLHEAIPGSNYKPAAWIVKLAQLHKKQTVEVPVRKPKPTAALDTAKADKSAGGADTAKVAKASDASAASATPAAPAPKPKGHVPMKAFFLLVSLGLFVSTLTGIYMSYKYGGSKVFVTMLLLAGIVVPLILLPF
jgi:hypothetical protein